MGKDPAFLFYSKDWLEGTAELTSEEKGVYIDLLAHQHQKGSLPAETKKLAKLSGLSEPEFCKIWEELSTKFIPNGSGRLVNRKLNGIVTERMDKGWRNKIIGTLASVVRYSNTSKEIAQKAKQTFKVDDFLSCTDQNLTERITEWYDKRLKSIANANGNAIKDENENKDHLESVYDRSLITQMIDIWVRRFPTYTRQKENDSYALRAIADFIFINAGIPNGYGNADQEIKALNTFELIADQVNREPFWVNKSLKSISNHIQEFYNKLKNPVNGTEQKSRQSRINEDTLKQKLAAKAPTGR
jgi:uncharacterized protein YdaU (DUF1376 family)